MQRAFPTNTSRTSGTASVSRSWSNVNNPSSPVDSAKTSAEEEALRWLIDLDDLNEVERAQFQTWLDARPENRRAFTKAERDWRRLDVVQQLASGEPDPKIVDKWLRRRRIKRRYLPLAAAAGIAALAAALSLPPSPAFEASYRTAVGEHRKILLPDESVLTLNTDSEASVVYTDEYRRVQLHRGEAHFVIEPARERPFRVEAGTGAVEVVGTAFNVLVKGDLVEVTVTEGVVEVLPHAGNAHADNADGLGSAAATAATDAPPLAQTLTRGERIRYRDGIESRSTLDPGEISRKLAWQDGMLDFQGDSLASVIEEAGRYTSIRMTIEDPEIANLSVTGYLKAGDVETLLALIESNELVAVNRITPDLVHITARRD